LAFLFVLGVLIFVHELGHFLMARKNGVRVLTFSLGWACCGPPRRHAAIASCAGGYVKMAGENADDAREGQSDEFLSKTKWERFQVLIAGPLMNILLAIVVLAAVLLQGADVPAYLDEPPVRADAGSARRRPKAGDHLERGRRVATWEQLFTPSHQAGIARCP
jgi:regulator of sigma E protease